MFDFIEVNLGRKCAGSFMVLVVLWTVGCGDSEAVRPSQTVPSDDVSENSSEDDMCLTMDFDADGKKGSFQSDCSSDDLILDVDLESDSFYFQVEPRNVVDTDKVRFFVKVFSDADSLEVGKCFSFVFDSERLGCSADSDQQCGYVTELYVDGSSSGVYPVTELCVDVDYLDRDVGSFVVVFSVDFDLFFNRSGRVDGRIVWPGGPG